jgi:hypothetical protein
MGDRATAHPGEEVDALRRPMLSEKLERYRRPDSDEPLALADSFAFASCGLRERRDQLTRS